MEFLNPKATNIQFTKYFKPMGIFAIVITVLSLLSIVFPGVNYGIDFRGGIEAKIGFADGNVDTATVRKALEGKLESLSVIKFEDANKKNLNEYLITAQGESKEAVSDALSDALKTTFGAASSSTWTVEKLDFVGPKAGSELRKSAILSLFYTCILITLFLIFRFDIRYSPGALISIFHDLALTMGFIVLMRIEFSVTVVAALLTLAGYSINDTVVIFDRIRETEGKNKGGDKSRIIDSALNETLSRTLLTALATLGSCLVLYFVGTSEIKDFALILFFGIIVGTFSSLFVSTPMYFYTDRYMSRSKG
ncbi:MAG TPA: protein translocase subunit SecF [Bdellovibrionota bacterium]|jgi:preprotein translocase subunit SecF|nr:protein translocase subunit SecF [Bdellovibrionota bacterium]